MDKEDYGLLKWLPMPTLSCAATLKDQKYKEFEAAHANNEKPPDTDRPDAKKYIEKQSAYAINCSIQICSWICSNGCLVQRVWETKTSIYAEDND